MDPHSFHDIKAKLAALHPSDCNPQVESPLFSTFPAEIRHNIFQCVLAEQDGIQDIPKSEYFYRPDYTHYRFIDTALLRTCRRVYLETRTMPMQSVTSRDWLGNTARMPSRVPIDKKLMQSLENESLGIGDFKQLALPHAMQYFAQMFALESWSSVGKLMDRIAALQPRTLTITLRHTDWYWWESDQVLYIDRTQLRNRLWPACLDTIVLELETRNGKKKELDRIVQDQVGRWLLFAEPEKDRQGEDGSVAGQEEGKGEAGEAEMGVFCPTGKPIVSTWVGAAKINGKEYPHHSQESNGTTHLGDDEMLYYVVKVVFKKMSFQEHVEHMKRRRDEETLAESAKASATALKK